MENQEDKQKNIQKEDKQMPKFDPYAPHKIKWWGWPLLILLIIGTIYIFRNNHFSCFQIICIFCNSKFVINDHYSAIVDHCQLI